MRIFRYNVYGHELTFTVSELQGTVTGFLVDGVQPEVSAEKMAEYAAAISLALLQYEVEVVHDEEEGIITLGHRNSSWNNPSNLMNKWDVK